LSHPQTRLKNLPDEKLRALVGLLG